MNSSLMAKVVGSLAALLLACSAFAAPPLATADAHDLLRQLHADAYQVRDAADQLEALNREPFQFSWETQAEALENMRDRINHMDGVLYELRSMEGMLPQGQQAEIDNAAPAMVELTDTTQAAIEFMNHNQDRLWVRQYTDYVNEMYSEASRAERSTVPINENVLANHKVNPSTETQNLGNGS